MKAIKYLFLWVFLVYLGCASSQFGWNQEPGDSGENVKMNEEFDPLSLDDDDISIDIDKAAGTEKTEQPASSDIQYNNPVSTDLTSGEDKTVQGFRVQLLATSDEEMAREEKKRAVFKFEDKVYLIFDAPMYKIRVGDCLTRKEAEELKKQAVSQGFTDAWIVPSQVVRR